MKKTLQIEEKHHLILRIVHWINLPLLLLMIWSGVLIYWANPVYIPVPDDIFTLKIHHRLAEGMGWHFLLMWFFIFNGLLYFIYSLLSGHWFEIIPTREDLKKVWPYLLYDLKLSHNTPLILGKYNPVQKIAYTGAFFMGIGSVITGLAIYKPVQLGVLTSLLGGYEAARFEHFLLMCGFLLFIVIHIIQVLRAGWNNLRAMLAGYQIKEDE